MKKITFLLIILVFPFAGICQGNTDLEQEKAAIKAVIEKETQAYINVDYKSWRDCYIQEEPYARINSGKESWGGANSWAAHDSSMNAGYQNYTGEKPLPMTFKNEDYKIRVTPGAAWAVYKENWFDKEGSKTGWNMNTRFLEKQNGEWKISYVGVLFADTYEQTAETENETTATGVITVPEIPLENKYALARSFMYNNAVTSINIVKAEGKTVEESGILLGDIYKAAWPEEKSFEDFAQDCIYHLVCLSGKRDSESPSVELTNQSENKIVFAVSDMHPSLYNQGEMWGTSYKELIKWWEVIYNQIAGKYNLSFTMEIVENKVIVTISKN